jgi:hypothetical protein
MAYEHKSPSTLIDKPNASLASQEQQPHSPRIEGFMGSPVKKLFDPS